MGEEKVRIGPIFPSPKFFRTMIPDPVR